MDVQQQIHWRRLLHSPASPNESTMLELLRAWEPGDRARAWRFNPGIRSLVVFLAETWLTKARLEEIWACYKF